MPDEKGALATVLCVVVIQKIQKTTKQISFFFFFQDISSSFLNAYTVIVTVT